MASSLSRGADLGIGDLGAWDYGSMGGDGGEWKDCGARRHILLQCEISAASEFECTVLTQPPLLLPPPPRRQQEALDDKQKSFKTTFFLEACSKDGDAKIQVGSRTHDEPAARGMAPRAPC